MDAVIRKWGNSPAVRLSAAAMRAAAFDVEQRVVIKATKGRIVIEPASKPEYKLGELVAGITSRNRRAPVDFGEPLGKELL